MRRKLGMYKHKPFSRQALVGLNYPLSPVRNKSLPNYNSPLRTCLTIRAMRKLSELYSELRQVHRRLESDLRGVRGVSDYEDDVGRREIEIQTQPRHTANTRLGRDDHEVNENADKRNEKRETGPSEQISHQGRRSYDAKRGASNSQSQFQGSPSPSNSVPLETLFTLAPTRPSRPFAMNRQRSKETGKARRRRQHSAIASDDGVDGLDDGVKYTGKPRRSIRR